MENTIVEILLVEDNLYDAELTINALRKSNISNKVLHVKDGVAALDLLFGTGQYTGKKINNQPKLILLDLKMPKLDGIEVLTRIKTDEITKRIPVVILTSSKQDPDIEKCYLLGANSYIVKPVGFDNFMRAVSDIGLYWMLLNQPPV